MIDLRLLELAICLDQHRNFGRAAAAVGVTQPTFSRGIASLEAVLGTRLFDRTNRRVEPTPAGAALLVRARTLLADASAFRDFVEDYKGLRSGRVTVGAGPYPLEISVNECVARLATRYPLLQIEVIEGQWRDFAPRLLSGVVEVAVMEVSLVTGDARFQTETLPPHQGRYYCRREHPLAGRSGLTVAQVLEYPLVGVRIPVRAIPPAAVGASGLLRDPVTGDLMPRITTTSIAASRAIVRRTDGVGMAVPSQIAEDIRLGHLVILDVDAATLTTAYGITHLSGRSLSPGASVFVATLKEVEKELAGASRVARRPGHRGHASRRPGRG